MIFLKIAGVTKAGRADFVINQLVEDVLMVIAHRREFARVTRDFTGQNVINVMKIRIAIMADVSTILLNVFAMTAFRALFARLQLVVKAATQKM